MPKDIRSFFAVVPSKKASNDSNKTSKESSSSKGQKKRAVIESDSDEESSIFQKKKPSKTNPSPDKKKPKIEQKVVNAADIFGTSSVKRTARNSTKKASEFHDDPDFDKVLQELDKTHWTEDDVKTDHKKPSSSKDSKNDIPTSTLKSSKKEPSQASQDHSKNESSPCSSTSSVATKHTKCEAPVGSPRKVNETVKKRMKLEEDKDQTVRVQKYEDARCTSKKVKEENAFQIDDKEMPKNKSNYDKEVIHQKAVPSSPVKQQQKDPKPMIQPSPPAYMWVDKYKPTSMKQIIGQQGDKSNVKKLLCWLSSWHSNHGPGVNKKHVRPSPWAKDDSGAFFKAALLSGPPGVGKTTTAHLVCKELRMDVVEFNASDTRSKKLMSDEVSELLSSKSLLPFFQSGGESKTSAKHVLVMDEVDGMAGNEDRGGIAELINLIKNSKCPVICMCNDRNHPKIRSLAGYCYDLRFYKPRVEQIRGAMMSVCFKEKVQIAPQALDEVIAGTNCDIRQILNNLSMWSSTEKKLNSDQVKIDANAAKKNIKLGPWDAIRKVFSSEDHKSMSLIDKSDIFFHDYSIMPLFVQENYLIASPHAAKKKTETLHHIARAASSISYGDLIEKTIRSRNSWSLLPVQSIFSSVVPGDWMSGHLTGQIQFPSWLGKNSKTNKMNRLLQELQVHMRLSISGGKQAVNLDYLEPVLNSVIHPLVSEGAQGVPKTLQAMQSYYVTRDDLDSLLELCRWPGQKDPMSSVDSKVKAALTRSYNKAGGFMTPYALDAPVKKKKNAGHDDDDGVEGGEEISDEGDSDDDVMDGMIKAKKVDKKENQGSAASSSQRSSSSRGTRGRGGGQSRGRGRGKK